MKLKQITILFLILIPIFCNELSKTENVKENPSSKDKKKHINELQKNITKLRRDLEREVNEFTDDTDRKRIERKRKKVSDTKEKISRIKEEIENLTSEMVLKETRRDSIHKLIENVIWEKEYQDRLTETNLKLRDLTNLLHKLKIAKQGGLTNNQLRRLNRDVQYYGKEFEKINQHVPNFMEGDSLQFYENLDNSIQDLSKVISNINNERELLSKRAISQHNKLKSELDEINGGIEEINNKIQDRQEALQDLENKLVEYENDIHEWVRKLKNNISDQEKEIKRLQIKIAETYGQLVRAKYLTAEVCTNELETSFKHFLKLENEIILNANKGNWNAALDLINLINVRLDSLDALLKKMERDLAIFKNLYKAEAFLIHYELGDSVNYSAEEVVRKYREVFFHQMNILKDYLVYFPKTTVYIDGHADTLEYPNNFYKNVELSKNRAKNVVDTLRKYGALDIKTKLKVDWFSKHVNRKNPQSIVIKDSGNVFDRRVEMRVIRPNEKDEEIPEEIKNFWRFRDSLKIKISGKQVKYFKHLKGFWTELSYEKYNNAPLIKIRYKGVAYLALLKNQIFKNIVERREMSEFGPKYKIKNIKSLELGSQLQTILHIKENPFRIEVSRRGVNEINEIPNEYFRNYLSTLK